MLRCSSDAPPRAATAQGSASPCMLCALKPALTQLLPHLYHLLHTHTHTHTPLLGPALAPHSLATRAGSLQKPMGQHR